MEKSSENKHNENIVAEIVVSKGEKGVFRYVGVLIRESAESIRVAFTAKNGAINDRLDIPKSDIVRMRTVEPSEVKET